MNKKKKKQNGFTIVELVIVIAVIGILAAVLIPTFTNLVKKAQKSTDQQLVYHINEAIIANETDNLAHDKNSKEPTMYDTLQALEEYGFTVEKMTPRSKCDIVWDSVTNRFALISYENGPKIEFGDDKNPSNMSNKAKMWRITKAGESLTDGYSHYLTEDWTGEDPITVNTGLDVGENTDIVTVNYTQKGDAQDAVIRTNSFSTIVNIDAPKDTVQHYGYAASVNVESIKGSSYDEYGTVGRIEIKQGHVEAMPGSEVFCLMESPVAQDKVVVTTVNTGAVIHKNSENINAANGIDKDTESGVANGHVDDCGPGRHSFSQLVVDSEHVYDVCTCCGYTLIRVVDSNGTEIKQTKNTLTAVEEQVGEEVVTRYVVASEVTTPVETYLTNNNIPTKEEGGQTVVDVENIQGTNIETDGNEGKPLETTPVVVSTDEEGNTIAIDRTCKHEFVYTDYLHNTDDICLGTCVNCGLMIHTQHDWVVKTQLPGQTEYSGICTKCGCTRETNVAQIVGGEKYATLPEAFAAVHTGTEKTVTIKLINNEKFDVKHNALQVDNGESIVLDLNGFQLVGYCSESGASSMILVNAGGTLTLKDSSDTNKNGLGTGKMISGASVTWTWSGVEGDYAGSYATTTISNKGTLFIESGYYESTATGSAPYVLDNHAAATISGGYLYNASSDAIRHGAYSNNISLTISGNTTIKSGYRAIWIQLPNSDTSSAPTVKLTINGGEFYKGDESNFVISDYTYGQNYTNTEYIFNDGVFHGIIGLSGGTNKTVSPKIEFNGGTIDNYIWSYYNGSDKEAYISGGSHGYVYGSELKSDYFTRYTDGMYHVIPVSQATDEDFVAYVGNTGYLSLNLALKASSESEAVKLNKDLSGFLMFNDGGNYTLDLNGHNIVNYSGSGNSDTVNVFNNTTLTITDSSSGEKGTISSEVGVAIWTGSSETDASSITINGGVKLVGNTYSIQSSSGTTTIVINNAVTTGDFDINTGSTLTDNR